MRLLFEGYDEKLAKRLSLFLTNKKIDNNLEGTKDTDWGSAEYGTLLFRVWIIEEDEYEKAHQFLQEFLQEPDHPRYEVPLHTPPALPQRTIPIPRPLFTPFATYYLLLICTLLHISSSFLAWQGEKSLDAPTPPLYASPIKKHLLYDYPAAYSILEKLFTTFGLEALQNPEHLPKEASSLIKEYEQHPFWQGFYEMLLSTSPHTSPTPPGPTPPLFEKIREGELWRIISPIFLHADLFHLLFNMLWLYVLGRQLEMNLGAFKYLLFIILSAAFTNTCQYLMSGPNFIGFSGVLCAMFAFMWKTLKDNPKAAYQIHPSTFMFMMIFILAMALLQTLSFLLEYVGGIQISTSVANTAHLSGALLGWLFAHLPIFQASRRKKI